MQVNLYNNSPSVFNSYKTLGNSSFNDAQVIFITEEHNSIINHAKNLKLIESIAQDHLILVENTPIGEKVEADAHPMTVGLRKIVQIQGWDAHGFREKINSFNQRIEEINLLEKECTKNLSEKKSNDLKNTVNSIREIYRRCRTPDDEPKSFSKFEDLMSHYIKSINKTIADDQMKFGLESFQERQDSLAKAIDQGIATHKKVIVLLGKNHICTNSLHDLTSIHTFLKDKKHTIFQFINPFEKIVVDADRAVQLAAAFEGTLSNNTKLNRTAALVHSFAENVFGLSKTITTYEVNTTNPSGPTITQTGVISNVKNSNPTITQTAAGSANNPELDDDLYS